MLDIKFIRENKDIVKQAILNKRASVDIDELISLDDRRLELSKICEGLRAEQNLASKQIAVERDENKRAQMISEMKLIKDDFEKNESDLREIMESWQKIMLTIPNIPSVDTPLGEDDSANVVIKEWGQKPEFSFTPKEHFEIGKALGVIDTETATEVASSRFAYLKGDLVLMQFALIQMCYELLGNKEVLSDIAKNANISIPVDAFMPIIPPFFVRPVAQVKMARFMGAENHYMFPEDDLMLIGSAEHTLGTMYMDKIIEERDLPIRLAGYSTAFRREAGTYGKDTNGILRQHQFDKLEMEVFSLPENSMQEQNFLVAIQEHILQKLNIPYQVLSVCSGDMGFPDYRQVDINSWMPGQNKYRETHSADLTGNFQSRRLNTRVRRADGKIEPVHMNDATAIAIGRMLIAIIENYQQEDGSVKIPEVLRPYLGNREFIGK
ncbi:MAG: serine--tRNA ligase [Candidatus Pacebacteria bacterium]|nr:serine--tRNA ligase [Candidatus Paceibacterota bacterium]MBP9772822.1 serine--tRNA ligase [Candidatus Paceibacterota bacterium]